MALGKISWTLLDQHQSALNKAGTQTSTLGTPALPTGSDWPTYLHDAQRTSASNETLISTANASSLTKYWSFKTKGIIAAEAVVVGGIVYVGSWDGYEYALNQLDGKLIWKQFLGITDVSNTAGCYPPKPGITSTATIANGVLYVGGGDRYWYALDALKGTILWKVDTGNNSSDPNDPNHVNSPDAGHYNWSSPLLYNGSAYIGVASECDNPLVQGEVMQVSLATHQVTNVFKDVPDGQVGGGVWTSPSVDPATNSIFISSGTQQGTAAPLASCL